MDVKKLLAITESRTKTDHYEMVYHSIIMKTQKQIRALKMELVNSVFVDEKPYFGLSLENLVSNN